MPWKNNQPYLEQEMLKAPVMISSHGRYNEIGRSCYYFADTKEGALTEVYKHCGSKKPSVQIAKLKKCKEARLIDLSQNVSKITGSLIICGLKLITHREKS